MAVPSAATIRRIVVPKRLQTRCHTVRCDLVSPVVSCTRTFCIDLGVCQYRHDTVYSSMEHDGVFPLLVLEFTSGRTASTFFLH